MNDTSPHSGVPLLELDALNVRALINRAWYPALHDVSLRIAPGEIRGLVGESGSGKSLTLRSIVGLLPTNVRVSRGDIRFEGKSLLTPGMTESLRGRQITMVFQEPSVALNPLMRVGVQITDGAIQLGVISRREANDYAVSLMEQVGIPDAGTRVKAYPHQLSGGLKQRVVIAAAIAAKPKLVLCDEPTTALDVTIQAQILGQFQKLCADLGAGMLYVTHDLAVVSELCTTVSVMYAGKIVEEGATIDMLRAPQHPYTRALLESSPSISGDVTRLRGIPGTTLALENRPEGYDFAMRLAMAGEQGTA